MFHGSMVALVTPMTLAGKIDEQSLRNLVDIHVAAGTDAIVAVGTTGEAATLSYAEQLRVINIVLEQVAGRIPVIAGTGTCNTAVTIALSQAAKSAGADACLVVTPYYNKPTQEGLYQHYKALAHAVAMPIILYNVPGRTAVDMLPCTVARLAAISNIIGIKEASGIMDRAADIFERCAEYTLDIYSGEDQSGLALMGHGAKGIISVTANVTPDLMHDMCAAALEGDDTQAEDIHARLMPLHQALFLESNPIPCKWALYRMGLIPEGIRLPLTPLVRAYQTELCDVLRGLSIRATEI